MNEMSSVEHHDEDGCHGKVRLHGRVRLDIMVNLYQGYVTMVKMDKRTWGMFKKNVVLSKANIPALSRG